MIVRLFNDHGRPAVLVLDLAILDAAQGIEELLRHRTWLVAEVIALACLEVVDIADGRDDGCRSAGSCLLEGLQFLLRDRTALHLHA